MFFKALSLESWKTPQGSSGPAPSKAEIPDKCLSNLSLELEGTPESHLGQPLYVLSPNRYKQKKELENQLATLKPFIDGGQAEEEQIREFYLLQIKKWISTSLEEIESIDQEVAILIRRDALKQVG